ncbi:asparagine synthase-related protein [Dyadobacter sediminis]|uniref:asparagine synthase (glutamine-hydrolyzing) n=1 Tax=Dyadobacter sediminis TaxID=1493691 RepID=A0A5R9K9B7_9BACT|nr:asparagine synthetase B family protein [Dyadobacter sediminis]TLU90580.1 hypothetical protein FEM55_18670 [Dyadobacter sediminis]GGC08961.1 asparagine synthetase B [Dyadobacter sediminis]
MLIEGFINYQFVTSNNNKPFFEKAIEFNHGLIGTHHLDHDPFNKFLVASFDINNKESTSLSNFLHDEILSFDFCRKILKNCDNKLRIAICYDEVNNQILLARELFGTIPLFYLHIPKKFFAFSTSLASLVSNKEVQPYLNINDSAITSYHRFRMDLTTKHSYDSFYDQIKSVLPGHIVTVYENKVVTEPYVTFNPEKWSHLSSLKDYGEAVYNIFKDSVRSSALNESLNVASHLSGGLDSSSVSTMFKHIFPSRTLHTLYHKSASKEMDESYYSESVVNKIGSIHHEVYQSKEDFDLIKTHTALYGEPEVSTLSPSLITTMMPFAKYLDCNILLRGSGGDSVIGSGMEVLGETFKEKKWHDFENLLRKRVPYFSLTEQYPNWNSYSFEQKYNLVLQNFLYNRISDARNLSLKDLVKVYREIHSTLRISNTYFLKRGLGNFINRLRHQAVNAPISILKDEYLQRPILASVEPVLPTSLRSNLPEHFQPLFEDVFTPRAVTAIEQQFVLGEHYGISNRSPFLDKDLFEVCMAVPNVIKYGNGKGREHFREAMKGLLSDEVLGRSSKATLASSHGQEITLRLYKQAEEFLNDTKLVWEYVDRKKFNEQTTVLENNRIPYTHKVRPWFHITRTISLALWLEWFNEKKLS